MSEPMGLALSSVTVAAASAYVCFHPAEVANVMWRTRSGAFVDPTTLRLLRLFALARIVALLGMTWASPDPTIGLIGASLMTVHAVLSDMAYRYHWPVMTFTRVLGGALIGAALIGLIGADLNTRIAEVAVGLVLVFNPQMGADEHQALPSDQQIFITRLVGAVGTVLFMGCTIQLLLEPTLLPTIAMKDVDAVVNKRR